MPDVPTARDHPDCVDCQAWEDAGASWPRPCSKHYGGEPGEHRALKAELKQLHEERKRLRDALESIWHTYCTAVSPTDAMGRIARKALARNREEAR